jgi:YebC/PmpR family DNA-binding regulatory protein
MSGHSRWAGIKHKKAAIDAKRGKAFTKLIREISIAARAGGGLVENNPRLRKATELARGVNMPSDNIKKAIQRGTGELPGVNYEEIQYEGYGPAGVAVICEITTDNKNRTASEIRRIFSMHSGNLGENGCVGWMFHQKGVIEILKHNVDEDTLMSLALDAGAEDVTAEDETFEIITKPAEFEAVKNALEKAGIAAEAAELTMVPQTYVSLTGADAQKMLRLMDALEESDDVKNVYANFDISPEEMGKYVAG